jgi:hypothetical protein
MAGTYFLLNSALTACAVAVESKGSVWELWHHHAAYLAINDYAAASLAILLVRSESGIDLQAVGSGGSAATLVLHRLQGRGHPR